LSLRAALRLRAVLIVLLALLLPLRVAVATAQVPCPFAGMPARVAAAPDPGCPHAAGGAPAMASSMQADDRAGTAAAVDRGGPAEPAAGHGTPQGHGKPCGACLSCASCAACGAGAGALAFALAAAAPTDRRAVPLRAFAACADPIASFIGTGLERPPRPR
jgi:hypothetical protein